MALLSQRLLYHLASDKEKARVANHPGTLQVPCAVALVRSFLQQEVATGIRHAKQELSLGGFQNALLHLTQFDLQHLLKLLAPQWMKHHHFVEAIHELRRKLAASRFHGGAFHLLVKAGGWLVLRLNEAHTALHEFGNFSAA